jgi:hypothetical protein
MKVIEGRKYLDTKHLDLASYMNNFNRESQSRDNESGIKSTNLDEITIIKLMSISLSTSFYSKLARHKA